LADHVSPPDRAASAPSGFTPAVDPSSRRELIDHLKQLVAKNKLDALFDEMDRIQALAGDGDLSDTALVLKSQYNRAKSDQLKGVVTREEAEVEETRIKHRLLSLLNIMQAGGG